jgi:ABC-type transporter Mla maintaining outer membrane lipid asymmetry ATPase subunit MlaF
MSPLLQFDNVSMDKTDALSFSLVGGETRILKVASPEIKTAVMDIATGELLPANGAVLLRGKPLALSSPGDIGWIPAMGGLISNLKTWENITLPLWYHKERQTMATEQMVANWLPELGLEKQEWEKFMASPSARLSPVERKMAGLLRGLVLAPHVLLIDTALFDEVDSGRVSVWINALEKFACGGGDHAVLGITCKETLLPWNPIE